MLKIIKGKKYNTETAQFCGEYEHLTPGDFEHYIESLYQKRTGEFFLYGEGGAASPYSMRVDRSTWSGGKKIIPLTEEEAREWTEKHLSAEKYEQLFTLTREEAEDKKVVGFSLSGETIAELTRLALQRDVSKSQLIADLIHEAASNE